MRDGGLPRDDRRRRVGRDREPLRLSIGRHPRDLAVLAVTVCGLALCAFLELLPGTDPIETAIFIEVQRLPAASAPVWTAFSWIGTWAGIGGAAAIALYLHRVRLGIKLAAAGALTWFLGGILQLTLQHQAVPGQLIREATRTPGADGFGFPSTHVAVAATLAAVAAPYLVRNLRILSWAVVVLVALADVYLGTQLPLGVVAGAFLGWGTSTIFHILWGAPGRKTSDEAVLRALRRVGVDPVAMVQVRRQLLGPLEYRVTAADGGELRVYVIRRLHRRAGPWYKLRRFLASVDVEDEPRLSTPRHEAEHEAYVSLVAERAGVRTPPVLLAAEIEHGPPFVVRRHITGRRLTELSPEEVSDTLLDEVWRQVGRLGAKRIAHHDLRAKNFLVDAAGRPWVLDFTFGRVGASEERIGQDAAEVLVSLAAIAGADRAVASAVRVLPADTLEHALPYLQPLALPRKVREQVDEDRFVLTGLREALADRLDRPLPTFRSPIRPATVAVLVVGGAAVYLLLPQLSSLPQVLLSLREARYGWLIAAFLTGMIALPVSALSIVGASRTPLPFWQTSAVQVAAAFTGRTTPGGVGFFGINIAYLERRGVRRASAVGVTVLNRAAMGVVSGVACLIGVLGLGTAGTIGRIQLPTGWPVLGAVFGALIIAGVLVGSPFGRRRIVRPSMEMGRELLLTVRHPVRALQLFGGSLGFLALSAFGLVASLAAFESDFSVLTVLAVYVVGSTLAQLAPTPGNLGAVETALVAGLTAGGVTPTAAVAAVLTFRLLTFWLPVLPGLAMFRYLQYRGTV